MHSKCDYIEIITYHDANEMIQELFESLLPRYQMGLETTMKDSNFIFDYVNLMYQKFQKINFK